MRLIFASNMVAVQCLVCVVVSLWSLLHSAVVSGQCTTLGCGVGYQAVDARNYLDAPHREQYSEFKSDLDELKLQTHLVSDELGKLRRFVV